MKQSKLRRKRVFRYALLYFTLLIIFLVLFIAPSLAGKYVGTALSDPLNSIFSGLVQPTGQDNNDTIGHTDTGTAAASYSGAYVPQTSSAAAASGTADAKIRLF